MREEEVEQRDGEQNHMWGRWRAQMKEQRWKQTPNSERDKWEGRQSEEKRVE